MTRKVVVIGAGAVGMTVATYLKRHTDHHIVVFSAESHTAYSQCGMPFVLGGSIPDFSRLIVKPPEEFKRMGIELHLATRVNHIDPDNRKIISDIGIFEYDILVIATGSSPIIPAIPGKELKGVFTLRTLSDCIKIGETVHEDSRVVVIGAGGIGVEVAAGLADRGIATALVEALPQVLPLNLDADMASIIQKYLTMRGIKILTGTRVQSINGTKRVESVTANDETLPADSVIMVTGVRPRTDIIQDAGFDIGPSGGIVTDERLRASYRGKIQDHVFAGGECAQVADFITGSPLVSRLGSAARRMARVISENISGLKAIYPPTLSPSVVVAKDLVAGSVGIDSRTAGSHSIPVISGSASGYTRAGYYPGAMPLYIKLLFSNRRLVGAQVVAGEGVKERIDALSLAIRMGATIDDLMQWETSYSPPVSGVIDPVTFAVDDAMKKIKG